MKKGFDPGIDIGGRLLRLDDETHSLDAVGAPDAAEDDVAQLLLGAQHVEARLLEHLSGEFQQHVGAYLLQPALKVHFDAVRRVHLIRSAVQEIAT